MVSLGDGAATVCIRGRSHDLQAIMEDHWLRAKNTVEGFLEAAGKLLVFLVAVFSGNLTQAGAIILMGLLLTSAGLLALSNANAQGFRMNGRVAAPTQEAPPPASGHPPRGQPGSPPYPSGRRGDNEKDTASWPGSSDGSGYSGMDDWAEKGQVGRTIRDSYPFERELRYN
jgi:hypothetical protein